MDIEKAKKDILNIFDEIETDITILTDRIGKARKALKNVVCEEDAKKYYEEFRDFENGLKRVELF